MMVQIVKKIYEILPRPIVNKLGKYNFLKPLRDLILRPNNDTRLLEVNVMWDGLNFIYKGDIKSAIKAERKGIESSMLRLSISLLKKYKNINDDAVIFDVGSSYGFLSTVWALKVAQQGKVYSFEASKKVFETASEICIKNKLQSVLSYQNIAIFNYDGELMINDFDGTKAEVSKTNQLMQINIPCSRLDTLVKSFNIQKLDLIKIDVDGPEYEVLEGAIGVVSEFKPIVIIETNSDKRIVDWLLSKGYSIYDMKMEAFKPGNQLPPNLIALPY